MSSWQYQTELRKEQNLSSKKDIENAFLLTKRSSRMLSMNCRKALACSDSFSTGTVSDFMLKR